MTKKAQSTNEKATIRFKKPKILTVDLPAPLTQQLQVAGYNVLRGTFGRPYKVEMGDGFVPVVAKAFLPNYSEQEIVIVDLVPSQIAEGPEGEKISSMGELDWYAKTSTGVVDPRPRVMTEMREYSDRILASGGAFVVFADARVRPKMVLASIRPYIGDLEIRREVTSDNWSFLSALSPDHIRMEADYGTEIKVNEGLGVFSSFLCRHLPSSTFNTTLHPLYPLMKHSDGPIFFPLARNKFGETVAGVTIPRTKGEGYVLILPQLEDKGAAVLDLIQNVLPELLPRLFPDHEGGRWVHREEYEHFVILERKAAQLKIQTKANEDIALLEREIGADRERFEFLHGLLTKSGKALVADVKRALEFIGFSQVIDVDETNHGEANRQEDLQVLDRSPSLLMEIKGLVGLPTEGDTLQITKYVLRRIKEWKRTDVIGLSLVNHQRNLPALERDHANAFTQQQVQDAAQNATGLLTTWDLFRLIRGMIRWNWPASAVKDVFYGHGRLPKVPTHYIAVGTVCHFWTDNSVISIDVMGEMKLGDRVGYLLADGFFEEQVISLQLENRPVVEAWANQRVGMKTTLTRREIPIGTTVFRAGSDG